MMHALRTTTRLAAAARLALTLGLSLPATLFAQGVDQEDVWFRGGPEAARHALIITGAGGLGRDPRPLLAVVEFAA